jgi:chaperonin GroES
VLVPIGDNVLIRPLDADVTSPGGIVLPDTAKKKPTEGEVVAVGSGRVLDNGQRAQIPVKAGDVVVYAKYGGTEVTLEGKDYIILSADQIYAVKS